MDSLDFFSKLLFVIKMNRPYCLNELKMLESDIHSKYRLSNVFAEHYPCSHRYRVKLGGRKEEFILESKDVMDNQTCSICFKLRTNHEFIEGDPIIESIKLLDGKDQNIDLNFIKNKAIFYKWLFQHDY